MAFGLKLIGAALAAVVAISAMVASQASAATFTSSAGATSIEAQDTGSVKRRITGQEVSCGSSTFTANAPAASFVSITVHVVFNECKTGLGTQSTVTGLGQHGEANSCDFVFYASGIADLICPAGQEVTLDSATCIVHIPGQAGLGKLTYTTSGKHLGIDVNITAITSNHTDGFLCPFSSGGHSNATVLESSSPITAIPAAGTLSIDP